jgi:hypothetical protein
MLHILRCLAAMVLITLFSANPAGYASPGDSQEKIAALYGDYRLAVDTTGKLWSKADWEAIGKKTGVPDKLIYYFSSGGMHITTTVRYQGKGQVTVQHFQPDMSITIKEFKDYFPEVVELITCPEAQVFTTNDSTINQRFQEAMNPVGFGVVIQKNVSPKESGVYTLISFNVRDNGRIIRDIRFMDDKMTIVEFTMEKVKAADVRDKQVITSEWKPMKNWFL